MSVMGPVVVFPDVEDLICNFLREQLEGFEPAVEYVSTRIPGLLPSDDRERPDTFVRVMRVGGYQRDIAVDSPTVAVESWALKESDAYKLAAKCRGLIYALDSVQYDGKTVQFYTNPNNEDGSLVNLPDPQSTHSRYTANYLVPVRGTV